VVGPQWIESILEVTGLDPLGVQAISIRIYGYLLPGISNVTNRLRYYSFLCWVLYNYTKKGGSNNLDDWRMYIRKAEFLFSLISDVHHINEQGSSSTVGSDTSTPLIKKYDLDVIDLTKYTQYEDSPDRYFQNKGGGFAQYYKGPMENLKLVIKGGPLRVQLAENVKTTGERRFGVKAALVFSKNRYIELFHNCITKGKVTRNELSSMAESLCACQIINNTEEYDLLVNLLFDADKEYGRSGSRRRKTFYLILKFLKDTKSHGLSIEEYRNICMYRHYHNGQSLNISHHYDDVLSIWHIYQMHEYFCYALQSLLYVFERMIDEYQGSFDDIAELIKGEIQRGMSASLPSDLKSFSDVRFDAGTKLDAFINSIAFSNKSDSDWYSNTISEYYLKHEIDKFIEAKNLTAIFCLAYILLVKIHLKTNVSKDFYNYGENLNFRIYSSNIITLNKMIETTNDLWAFIRQVLRECVVDRHTIVALRKFRYEKKSTLRYSIEKNVYVRTNKLKYDVPVFTNPRLQQAFRFLEDLGMAEKMDNKKYIITSAGKQFLVGINEL